MTSLSLRSVDENEPAARGRRLRGALVAFFLLLAAAVGSVGYWVEERIRDFDGRQAAMAARMDEAMALARQDADAARQEATSANEKTAVAQAVRDYLVKAGLPADILSVEGHGKSRPFVAGNTDAARAKNRRVELGIVNIRIRYGR